MAEGSARRIRISIARSGGFAGITRHLGEADTAELGDEQSKRLPDLVEQTRFFDLPPVLPDAEEIRDGFVYTVIVSEDDRTHVVRAGEGSVVQPLVDFVRELP